MASDHQIERRAPRSKTVTANLPNCDPTLLLLLRKGSRGEYDDTDFTTKGSYVPKGGSTDTKWSGLFVIRRSSKFEDHIAMWTSTSGIPVASLISRVRFFRLASQYSCTAALIHSCLSPVQ